jgi:hypothetical protein
MNTTTNGLQKGDQKRILTMVLSSPGMTEKCKFSLSITRQCILLLSGVIEKALSKDAFNSSGDVLDAFPENVLNELMNVQKEMLDKAQLKDFYDNLSLI